MKDKHVAIPTSSHKGPMINFIVGKKDTQEVQEEEATKSEPYHSIGKGSISEEVDSEEKGNSSDESEEEEDSQEEDSDEEEDSAGEQESEDQEGEQEGDKHELRHDEEQTISPQENVVEDLP